MISKNIEIKDTVELRLFDFTFRLFSWLSDLAIERFMQWCQTEDTTSSKDSLFFGRIASFIWHYCSHYVH